MRPNRKRMSQRLKLRLSVSTLLEFLPTVHADKNDVLLPLARTGQAAQKTEWADQTASATAACITIPASVAVVNRLNLVTSASGALHGLIEKVRSGVTLPDTLP